MRAAFAVAAVAAQENRVSYRVVIQDFDWHQCFSETLYTMRLVVRSLV